MSEFFEAPPPRPEVEEPEERKRPAWLGPPRGVLPCAVPVSGVVARTEEIAIGMAGVFAYPTGFEAEIVVVARSARRLAPFRDPFDEHGATSSEEGSIPEHLLRLGLDYSDGRKSMNTNLRWPDMDEESDGDRQPTMRMKSGSGDEGEWRQTFWFCPLPSPGPLHLVCEWPAQNLSLTRHEIDSQQILEAAESAEEIFPPKDAR